MADFASIESNMAADIPLEVKTERILFNGEWREVPVIPARLNYEIIDHDDDLIEQPPVQTELEQEVKHKFDWKLLALAVGTAVVIEANVGVLNKALSDVLEPIQDVTFVGMSERLGDIARKQAENRIRVNEGIMFERLGDIAGKQIE